MAASPTIMTTPGRSFASPMHDRHPPIDDGKRLACILLYISILGVGGCLQTCHQVDHATNLAGALLVYGWRYIRERRGRDPSRNSRRLRCPLLYSFLHINYASGVRFWSSTLRTSRPHRIPSIFEYSGIERGSGLRLLVRSLGARRLDHGGRVVYAVYRSKV
jgi:hypothetical protein